MGNVLVTGHPVHAQRFRDLTDEVLVHAKHHSVSRAPQPLVSITSSNNYGYIDYIHGCVNKWQLL